MSLLASVTEGVAAEVLSALIVSLIGILGYFALYFTGRQRRLHFFGIRTARPRLRIYLSRLEIIPSGTVGFEPLTRGYSGPSITKLEYEGALLVRDLLRSSILALLPERIAD